MAFTASQLEDTITWCAESPRLGLERRQAQRQFFGNDDARPVKYWECAGDSVSRPRRFVGWLGFDFGLPDDVKFCLPGAAVRAVNPRTRSG